MVMLTREQVMKLCGDLDDNAWPISAKVILDHDAALRAQVETLDERLRKAWATLAHETNLRHEAEAKVAALERALQNEEAK